MEHYLYLLRIAVEKRYGAPLQTSRDYYNLSDEITESKAGSLSASTLKRLWGYVRDSHGKHRSTLDILARYAGYEGGFRCFCAQCDASSSGFEKERVLDVFALHEGAMVAVTWEPERHLMLRYLGRCVFTVAEATNTKIATETKVRCARLIDNEPLLLDILDKADIPVSLYHAGKINGIHWEILN